MPRAIWSGSISFGLVNIPIKLFSAVSRKTVRFNQIDSQTGARVKQKRVSALDGSDVDYDDIVKGYELPSGEYVTISQEELDSLDPEAVRTIDILEFIDLDEIDPMYYDSAYHLVPDPTTVKPYKLLADAMAAANKVAIARFVMRTKQYLAAIRPQDGTLVLSTMVYADELVSRADIGEFDALDDIKVEKQELAMAEQLIASLDAEFEPGRHIDTYREAVLDLIERKVDGETDLVASAPEETENKVVDLMAALEASVAQAKDAKKRHPASKTGQKSSTRKSSAKKAPAAKKKPAKKKSA